MRVAIELGPKGRKHAAYAIDWPGLERNGPTPEAAVAHVAAYRDRYTVIAERAGMLEAFRAEPEIAVTLTYPGVGSTDFWGISFAHSVNDHEPLDAIEFERQIMLLQACWAEFDAIAARVSPELRKGPRGGGRDRDQIVRHLLAAEIDWVRKLGLRLSLVDVVAPADRAAFNIAVVDALRAHHSAGTNPQAKGGPAWTLPFFVRHLAFHVLDHAWEMEDKDLTSRN